MKDKSLRNPGIALVAVSCALVGVLGGVIAVATASGGNDWLLGIGIAIGAILVVVGGIGIGLIMSSGRSR